MKKLLVTLLGLAVFSAITGYTSEAMAYVSLKCNGYRVKWIVNEGIPMLRPAFQSFPDGSAWKNAIQEAVDRWYQTPGNMWYNAAYGDTTVGIGNGENEIWFTTPNSGALGGAYAKSIINFSCDPLRVAMEEVDVLFNNGHPYTPSHYKSDLWPYGGGFRPFQGTAIQQLGYGLGLLPEGNEYNSMGVDFTHIHANDFTATSYVGEDAAYGTAQIYGLYPDSYEDLSVAHWKYAGYGSSDGFSAHDRTRIYDSVGNLSYYYDAGEPRYIVYRGQQVQAEFTYENNGTNAQNTVIDFRLSSNQYISSSDTWIGAYYLTLNRGSANTYTHTVTIPNNISPGKYSLGVLIDRDNTLGEMREDNNATYINVDVK